MTEQRVRFKVTNDMNPEKLDNVLSHFEEIFQQHGLEVFKVDTKFYGTNIKIKGGDVIHADVGLDLNFVLKYQQCKCRANMRGFFITPTKWPKKKWTIENVLGYIDELEELENINVIKPKMTTLELIKYIKTYTLKCETPKYQSI